MYNPFKPHIIKRGNDYLVRKFSIDYGWMHLNKVRNIWDINAEDSLSAHFDSVETAIEGYEQATKEWSQANPKSRFIQSL